MNVQQPAGRPQKPQSAETQPKPEPNFTFVEPCSHGLALCMQSAYAICACVQFDIFSVPCRETNMYYLMCGTHLICLYSFFASLITRAEIVLVSVLWMFFFLPILKAFGPPFLTSRRRYKMAQTLKKPHTKALSPYVTTEPCNNTCLGTGLLPLLRIGTSFSCPFP